MAVSARDPEAHRRHALDRAYRYLARRERTVLEMRRHLQAARIEPDTIEATIGTLTEEGYLDDGRYARIYADDRRRLDGWGAERIERRLRAAGVPTATVDAVLAERAPAEELAGALEVLRRRLGAPPADERGRERALGLLVRRGYGLETAYDAVRAFEREPGAPPGAAWPAGAPVAIAGDGRGHYDPPTRSTGPRGGADDTETQHPETPAPSDVTSSSISRAAPPGPAGPHRRTR